MTRKSSLRERPRSDRSRRLSDWLNPAGEKKVHSLVDKVYQVPYPSTGIESLMARLNYIHSKEKLDVIIPNFDAELFPYIKLESRLKKLLKESFFRLPD